MVQHPYSIGQTSKGTRRVWLDGQKLVASGFSGGVYRAEVKPGSIVCRLGEEGPGKLRRITVRQGTGKPIIDITGKDVEEAFRGCDRVLVTFEGRLITIVGDPPVHVVEARRAVDGQKVEVFLTPGVGIWCCVLARDGEKYVMNGISGTHSLFVHATDDARLAAHWACFREENLRRAAAPLEG